jgi:branched-chain amino acid aminotransferase
VFRLEAHLERLYASAATYGIEIPYALADLTEAIHEVIAANEFRSCYVRPICFFGSDGLGLHPGHCPVEVAILVWPWAAYLGAEGLKRGIRVTVSPWLKFHSQMMPTTAKACGQYLNSILAMRDAAARGFDEALLLDSNGSVAEGSGENLFIVNEGRILTNDERHSILMGVTRDSVIQIARDLGYPIVVKELRLSELLMADEAFFTGTAAEVTAIREVDGTQIGNGACGDVTSEIQKTFFAATAGRVEKYRNWLSYVTEGAPV